MRQIVLDTETTGLDPSNGHRILEIACIELIDRTVTDFYFHSYVNPKRDSEASALAVHGITTEFLADKPLFAEIADEFLDFIKGAELLIHNAPFDLSFLNNELSLLPGQYGSIEDYCTVFDTLLLARQLHPGQRNSLDALCKRYKINNSHRNLHGALLDGKLLLELYLIMTGGQGSFFSSEEKVEPSFYSLETFDQALKGDYSSKELFVLLADEEEVNHHRKQLQTIKTTYGDCLWLSFTDD